MVNPNPYAFPFPEIRTDDGYGLKEGSDGMTLRDYFAGQAIVEYASLIDVKNLATLDVVARLSYQTADAMLAARTA